MTIDITWLSQITSTNSSREITRRPHRLTIGDQPHAMATDGRVMILVAGDFDLPTAATKPQSKETWEALIEKNVFNLTGHERRIRASVYDLKQFAGVGHAGERGGARMSGNTRIEWTDVTWNPVRGCSLISDGCKNCYAMAMAHRFSRAGKPYAGLTKATSHGPVWTGKVSLHPELIEEPARWRKPQRIFVNSMSDLFHEGVPDDFIAAVFATMGRARQHTYQILTKRPERMLSLLRRWERRQWQRAHDYAVPGNVWLGVSVEDQETAEERIPLLLQTPAALRWISAEPLLGPIDLTSLRIPEDALLPAYGTTHGFRFNALQDDESKLFQQPKARIDWIVVGGESGPGARPFSVDAARSLVAQCRAAGVPIFVKQLGRFPYSITDRWSIRGGGVAVPVGTEWSFFQRLSDSKGGDPEEWPVDLRVREFPSRIHVST